MITEAERELGSKVVDLACTAGITVAEAAAETLAMHREAVVAACTAVAREELIAHTGDLTKLADAALERACLETAERVLHLMRVRVAEVVIVLVESQQEHPETSGLLQPVIDMLREV